MKRSRRLLALSGLALGVFALPLWATPPVMDHVPDDAMFVALIPSPETLQKNISALSTAIEFPMPLPSIKDMLAQGGMGSGLDFSKAIAVVVMSPPKNDKPGDNEANDLAKAFDSPEELAVALFPVTSYAEFLNNFGVKPAGAGKVDSITMGPGQAAYVKDIGGNYVALADKQGLVEKFTGKSGATPLKGKLGKAGEALTDSADIALVVNMDAVRPFAPQAIAEMKKEAKQRADSMGAAGADVEAQMQMVAWLFETVARDGRAVVGSIRLGSMGVGLDSVTNFNEGSYFAKTFAAGGSPAALFGKLPAQKFLFAAAVDTGAAGVKTFLTDIVNKAGSTNPEAAKSLSAFLAQADGHSAMIGFPEGGATAGLLSSALCYTKTKDPASAVQAIKSSLAAMNGKGAQGATLETSYVENGAKVDNTNVDVWTMKVTGQGDANQAIGMMTTFMFGPQGEPSGYVVKTPDGVYRTATKNPELVRKALSGADTLASDKLLAQVGEQLPKNRIAEAYLGMRPVVDIASFFVSMMGIPMPVDKVPEKLPPIGLALASDNGAAHTSIFVPAPVIKTGIMLGTAISDQMSGQDNEGAPEPNQGKGTGQPKF